MKTAKSEQLFMLKASLVSYYMIVRAIAQTKLEETGVSILAKDEISSTHKTWKNIRTQARKAGISNKVFYNLDNQAHAVAWNWYSV
jgi:hypothetical protein